MKKANDPGVTPLGDRVLVRRHRPAERTGGGIYVPDTAKKKVAYGVVVAVGEGDMPAGWGGRSVQKEIAKSGGGPPSFVAVEEPTLVGKTVCFSEYAGVQLPDCVGGHELLVMLRSDEVVAVLG